MVEKLMRSLEVYTGPKAGEVLDFGKAAYSATIDITTNYSFGMSWNLLEQPNFESPLIDRVRWITYGGAKIVCFPRTAALVRRLNEWFPKWILTNYSLMKAVRSPHSLLQQSPKLKSAITCRTAGKLSVTWSMLMRKKNEKGFISPDRSTRLCLTSC